jgi:hypothetical protein
MNASELRFKNMCLGKKFQISKATKNQDIYEHWDFKVNKSLVDVKGLKKVSRSDGNYNHDIAWLEIQNVRGNLGWLKGKADFIAFEQKDYFLIVERGSLLNWLRKKITNVNFVTSSRLALYRLYQRSGRKDIISMVKISDFKKEIKYWRLF